MQSTATIGGFRCWSSKENDGEKSRGTGNREPEVVSLLYKTVRRWTRQRRDQAKWVEGRQRERWQSSGPCGRSESEDLESSEPRSLGDVSMPMSDGPSPTAHFPSQPLLTNNASFSVPDQQCGSNDVVAASATDTIAIALYRTVYCRKTRDTRSSDSNR